MIPQLSCLGRDVDQDSVKAFAEEAIAPGLILYTDAFTALRVLAEGHHHVAKVTPPELVDKWLPWVHVVISKFKSSCLASTMVYLAAT